MAATEIARTMHEIREALLLLGVLPADLHAIAGRQRLLKRHELRPRRAQALRGKCTEGRETFHGDGAKMLQAAETLRFQRRLQHRHLQEGDFLGTLRGIDVQVLEISELGAFVHPQARHDRDLLVSSRKVATCRPLMPADRGHGHVQIRHAGKIGPIGIDVELHQKALVAPVVPTRVMAGIARKISLTCSASRRRVRISSSGRRSRSDRPNRRASKDFHRIGLELAHVQERLRHRCGERLLQVIDEQWHVLLVRNLDDELRVVQLLQLGRHREPEARPTAAHKRGERFEDWRGLPCVSGCCGHTPPPRRG